MNGESPTMAPVSGLRSGAPGGSVSSPNNTTTASTPNPANLSPRDSSALIVAPAASGFSPLYSPSRGEMTLSVMNETMKVNMMTDATENQKFAVRSMERSGLRMWMASLVISVRMPSSGLMRMLTVNTAATPAKDAARPARG